MKSILKFYSGLSGLQLPIPKYLFPPPFENASIPPGLSIEYIVQLDRLLSCITELNTTPKWKVAVEFRNRSWYDDRVYDLLNFYKASIVIQDMPKSATPFINHKSDFKYIRFHGPTGNYRDS